MKKFKRVLRRIGLKNGGFMASQISEQGSAGFDLGPNTVLSIRNMSSPVFCHYMVGGIQEYQASIDITQAKSLGFDAFALNIISTDAWSLDAISYLFQAAALIGFHLFFSFDMTQFSNPSQFIWLLQMYIGNPAYYHFDGLPFVSTFYGSTLTLGQSTPQDGWHVTYKQALQSHGVNTYFVPAFSDSDTPPSDMYNTFPVAQGLMSWDTAWPWATAGKVNVTSDTDLEYIGAAKVAEKTYMMPMSSFQFKHLDPSQNWYRRGELALAERIPQILSAQPDFVEFLTWNDAGESTYIGNIWPDTIGPACAAYSDGFDHTGWQALIAPFISAYKAGAKDIDDVVPLNGSDATGVFWYRSILTSATCASDPLGKPSNWSNAEDAVNVAVLLSAAAVGAKIDIYSGGALIGSKTGIKGLNAWSIPGLKTGTVKVEVTSSSGSPLISGTGSKDVAPDAAICNYNYQVMALK